jgi:hypothetical protein
MPLEGRTATGVATRRCPPTLEIENGPWTRFLLTSREARGTSGPRPGDDIRAMKESYADERGFERVWGARTFSVHDPADNTILVMGRLA